MNQAQKKEKLTTEIDLNKFCRLCLNKSDELINIFHNNENCSINLRIMSCAALEVSIGLYIEAYNIREQFVFF